MNPLSQVADELYLAEFRLPFGAATQATARTYWVGAGLATLFLIRCGINNVSFVDTDRLRHCGMPIEGTEPVFCSQTHCIPGRRITISQACSLLFILSRRLL